MSALGQKQTSIKRAGMSALCHYALQRRMSLFDHLVGGCEQRRRHCQVTRFGSFETNRQIELDRLFGGNVSRFGATQKLGELPRAPGASLAISAPQPPRCMVAAGFAGVLRMFRLAVADLDSPSYFVATAAVELGCFKDEGIEVELERIYGAYGGPAYAATVAFPAWNGAKLLCALAQYSYWFLAVRADLQVKRGDVAALKGMRISSSLAAPVLGLKHLLTQAGIDLERDNVRIVPAPPSGDGRWMGHAGVKL